MGKRVMRYRRRRIRYRGIISLVLLLCAVGGIAYGVHRLTADDQEANSGAVDAGEPNGGQAQDTTEIQTPEDDVFNDGVMPEAGQDGDAKESDPPQADAVYVFGEPVSEGEAVSDDWFSDAVFLGDSRTEGLQLYSGIAHGTFFWEWGMSVFKADDTGHRKVDVNGEKMTLMEALSTGSWDKVYIMIGVNDLGYQAASYQKALGELVDRVREIQGDDSVIYLQTMPPINDAIAQENGMAYYVNTENVNAFNEAIVQVAKEKRVALVDTASCLTDDQGQLFADMCSDGVHFKRAGYETWLDYLKTHTLSTEEYTAAQQAANIGGGSAA